MTHCTVRLTEQLKDSAAQTLMADYSAANDDILGGFSVVMRGE